MDSPYRTANATGPLCPLDNSSRANLYVNDDDPGYDCAVAVASNTSSRPIAQMKPASSRATAVTASAGCFPRPSNFFRRL